MTLQDLGSIGEFVAAIATLATLIYLALQIRQNTQSVRAAAELGLSQQSAEWMSRITAQPELGRIWDTAATDPASLSPEDVRRFRWIVGELFLIYEGQYHLFRRGHITDSSWKGKADLIQAILKNPVATDWWEKRMTPFSDEFFQYGESLRALPDGSWVHQEVAGPPTPTANATLPADRSRRPPIDPC